MRNKISQTKSNELPASNLALLRMLGFALAGMILAAGMLTYSTLQSAL